jgi:hypothetical protein
MILQSDLTLSLQHQLDKAHGQLATYAEKSRLQDLAITSAQKQLMELRLIIEKKPKNTGMDESEVAIWRQKVEQIRLEMDEAKLKHSKALLLEKERCTDYEQRCLQLEKRLVGLEQRSTQDTGFFSGLTDALHVSKLDQRGIDHSTNSLFVSLVDTICANPYWCDDGCNLHLNLCPFVTYLIPPPPFSLTRFVYPSSLSLSLKIAPTLSIYLLSPSLFISILFIK